MAAKAWIMQATECIWQGNYRCEMVTALTLQYTITPAHSTMASKTWIIQATWMQITRELQAMSVWCLDEYMSIFLCNRRGLDEHTRLCYPLRVDRANLWNCYGLLYLGQVWCNMLYCSMYFTSTGNGLWLSTCSEWRPRYDLQTICMLPLLKKKKKRNHE